MQFIKTEGATELEGALTTDLNNALAKNKIVVWLVTGGSNISVEVKIMTALEPQNLKNLTIMLTDERYVTPGHPDSNYFQLHQAGFNEREATFKDILSGVSMENTVKTAGKAMELCFNSAETIIGLFGLGPDGHIAGILPHSSAITSDEVWMVGYDGGQYRRITPTPFALSHIQTAFLGVYSEGRQEQLENLRDKMLPISEQPAQILRHIPKCFIYNNVMGEKS